MDNLDFSAYRNENASLAELTACFLSFEKKQSEVETGYEQARQRLVELQTDSICGLAVEKELKATKAVVEDLSSQFDACSDATFTVRKRMEKLLESQSKTRIDTIPAELEKIQQDYDDGYKDFLILCAKAVVFLESVEGSNLSQDSSGHWRDNPKLSEISVSRLSHNRAVHFLSEVQRIRSEQGKEAGKPCLRDRISALQTERKRLESVIETGSAEQQIEKILRDAGSKTLKNPDPEIDDYVPNAQVRYEKSIPESPEEQADRVHFGKTTYPTMTGSQDDF